MLQPHKPSETLPVLAKLEDEESEQLIFECFQDEVIAWLL